MIKVLSKQPVKKVKIIRNLNLVATCLNNHSIKCANKKWLHRNHSIVLRCQNSFFYWNPVSIVDRYLLHMSLYLTTFNQLNVKYPNQLNYNPDVQVNESC